MEFQQFERLMTEVGPASDLVTSIVRYDEQAYEFCCGPEDVLVLCELDEQAECLTLKASLGTPPAEQTLRIYDLMLTITGQSHRTGGLRMGIDEVGGDVYQLTDLPAAGLDVFRFQAALTEFVGRVQRGRVLVMTA